MEPGWTTGGTTTRRSVVAFSPKRYRYDLRSLRKQKEKADAIAAGTKAAKQARFVRKQGGEYVVNEAAFDRAQALAGWKSYLTSLPKDQVNGHQIVNYYHELYHVEQAFRMAKTDLRARPMYHHDHDAIKAHLAVVFAALAMSTHIYQTTGITTPKLLQQLTPLRHAHIKTGTTITAIPPVIPPEIQQPITQLKTWKPGD